MSPPPPVESILDIIQLRRPLPSSPSSSLPPPKDIAIHPNAARYETVCNPVKMGNAMPIAYGGCAVGVASSAAHQALAEMGDDIAGRFVAYSMLGQYLGPANPSTNFTIFVSPLRATRSFITKTVLVCQLFTNPKDPNSRPSLRPCMSVTVDFVLRTSSPSKPDRSLFTYSTPPTLPSLPTPSALKPWPSVITSDSNIPPAVAKAFLSVFKPALTLFEIRAPREGALTDNLWGLRKEVKAGEWEKREVWEKRSYDWAKVVGDLSSRESEGRGEGALPIRREAANASALAFHMDAALSFIPLSLTHRFLDDAGAASSLEFALRIHRDNYDLQQWHIREMKTVAGGNERTYGESSLWDEKGRMVATMTQACVMRPLSEDELEKRRKKREERKAKL